MDAGALARLLGRALLWGAAWSLLAPLAGLVPMIAIYIADTRCGTPGDSGGCEMGMASVLIGLVPTGFALGFLVTLIRGILRLRRAGDPAPPS
jgi:hypothetical protein